MSRCPVQKAYRTAVLCMLGRPRQTEAYVGFQMYQAMNVPPKI